MLLLLAGLVVNNNLWAADEGIDILKKSDNLLFPPQAQFTFRLEDYENNVFKRYDLKRVH